MVYRQPIHFYKSRTTVSYRLAKQDPPDPPPLSRAAVLGVRPGGVTCGLLHGSVWVD